MNQNIISVFEQLIQEVQTSNQPNKQFKIRSYRKVIQVVKSLKEALTLNDDDTLNSNENNDHVMSRDRSEDHPPPPDSPLSDTSFGIQVRYIVMEALLLKDFILRRLYIPYYNGKF